MTKPVALRPGLRFCTLYLDTVNIFSIQDDRAKSPCAEGLDGIVCCCGQPGAVSSLSYCFLEVGRPSHTN